MGKLSDKYVKGFRELMGKKWSRLTHDEYHDKKARMCGCGTDCCNNLQVLKNQTTGEPMYGALEDVAGTPGIVWRTKAEMKVAYPDMNL